MALRQYVLDLVLCLFTRWLLGSAWAPNFGGTSRDPWKDFWIGFKSWDSTFRSVPLALGVPSPFFPGVLLSRKPSETMVEKNEESTPR